MIIVNILMIACVTSVGLTPLRKSESPLEYYHVLAPIQSSLDTLEDIIKSEEAISKFCHKHYNINFCKTNGNYSGQGYGSCAELLYAGFTNSNVYDIFPKPWFGVNKFQVYCDMETEGGGWTVIQRRRSYLEVSFDRDRIEYVQGFGELTDDFWLGNEYIRILSKQDNVELRVDVQDINGTSATGYYDHFELDDFKADYKLKLGNYKGNLSNGLSYSRGATFKTFDHDDAYSCAKVYKVGWWYNVRNDICFHVNLNALKLRTHNNDEGHVSQEGMTIKQTTYYWDSTTEISSNIASSFGEFGLINSEMKIRPKEFKPL